MLAITGPAAVLAALLLCALLLWWADRSRFPPAGRKVTVSLSDGSVLTGRTAPPRPGRIRLVEVETSEGEVPGMVIVNGRHVLTVQVVS